MSKIKCAIIGMGVGEKHFEAIKKSNFAEIIAICDFKKSKIKYLKKKYPKIKIFNDAKDIFDLKELDVVSIASYDKFHFEHIKSAYKKKLNFIVEKPICSTLSQLKKINNYNNKYKLNFTSNFVLRQNDLFKKIKKKLLNKNIYYIEADYLWGRKQKLFGWRSKDKDYSIISGGAIHMIDLINWFLDSLPIEVFTMTNKNSTLNSSFDKDSFCIINLKYKNNIIVKLTMNTSCIHNHFHELKIFQKESTIMHNIKGTYEIKKKNNQFITKNITGRYPDKSNRKKLIINFLKTLRLKAKNHIHEKYIINLMNVCFAAEKSVKEGKIQKIKYFK